MPIYVILACLALALSIPLLWTSLASDRIPTLRGGRNLALGLGLGPVTDARQLLLARSAGERALRPLRAAFHRRAHRLTPAGLVGALDRRLQLAGNPWTLERVLATKVGLGGLAAVTGATRAVLAPSRGSLALAALGTLAAYFLIDVVLYEKGRKRQAELLLELPDTLDQITICVDAGLGFDAALAWAARTGDGVLAAEIQHTLQDIQIGVPRSEALGNLLGRTDVPGLRRFVHAVSQAETYGVPISQALRLQAEEERERRKQRAEERAMKVPVKIVFPLVLCMLPAVFVVVLGPSALRLMDAL